MSVGDTCNRAVVVVEHDAEVLEAARLMRRFHVGDLVVVEPRDGMRVPVGILTDRDLVVEILAEEVDPSAVSVRDFMTTDLLLAREDEELADVIDRMRTRGVRRVPVVDGRGALVGILCADDILELLAEELGGLARLVNRERYRETRERP